LAHNPSRRRLFAYLAIFTLLGLLGSIPALFTLPKSTRRTRECQRRREFEPDLSRAADFAGRKYNANGNAENMEKRTSR
jgi:hypothetical protein